MIANFCVIVAYSTIFPYYFYHQVSKAHNVFPFVIALLSLVVRTLYTPVYAFTHSLRLHSAAALPWTFKLLVVIFYFPMASTAVIKVTCAKLTCSLFDELGLQNFTMELV